MIQLRKDMSHKLLVRLSGDSGAPVTGAVFGAVAASVWKSDGTVALITVTALNWEEVTSNTFATSGTYALTVPASATDVVGELAVVVKTAASRFTVRDVEVVDNKVVDVKTPYVSFIGGGETAAPILFSVVAPLRTQIRVTYSEAVVMTDAANGALKIANYTAPGLVISSAVSVSDRVVLLTTNNQTPGATYDFTVTGVEDLNGNVIA